MALGAVTAFLVLIALAGCSSSGSATPGTTRGCPDRNAYCAPEGASVARPDAPATSPSGTFRLEVLPAEPSTAAEDWRFRIVTAKDGSIAFEPARPWFDGGLGTVITWGPGRPDTVWVAAMGEVRRWRLDAGQQTWVAATPGPDETLPDVVRAARSAGAGTG